MQGVVTQCCAAACSAVRAQRSPAHIHVEALADSVRLVEQVAAVINPEAEALRLHDPQLLHLVLRRHAGPQVSSAVLESCPPESLPAQRVGDLPPRIL